jgi:hypothetical protein
LFQAEDDDNKNINEPEDDAIATDSTNDAKNDTNEPKVTKGDDAITTDSTNDAKSDEESNDNELKMKESEESVHFHVKQDFNEICVEPEFEGDDVKPLDVNNGDDEESFDMENEEDDSDDADDSDGADDIDDADDRDKTKKVNKDDVNENKNVMEMITKKTNEKTSPEDSAQGPPDKSKQR